MNSYLKQYEKKSGKKIENKSVVFLLLLVQLMKLLENVSRETFSSNFINCTNNNKKTTDLFSIFLPDFFSYCFK